MKDLHMRWFLSKEVSNMTVENISRITVIGAGQAGVGIALKKEFVSKYDISFRHT